jgi:hypothetical protein
MNERLKTGLCRRDILAIAISGPAAELIYAAECGPANARPVDLRNKRKARYEGECRRGGSALERPRLPSRRCDE